jgi:hypothetical protein
MASRPAFILATLISAVFVSFFSEAVHDAWIKITWPQATATVVGPWHEVSNDRSGKRFDAPLTVKLPDGKTVMGRPIRPFPSVSPPTLGYALPVRLNPSDPSRMMAEASIVQNFPLQAAINLLISAILACLLFQFFRGNRPQLPAPGGGIAERARLLFAKVKNRQMGGAPPREGL